MGAAIEHVLKPRDPTVKETDLRERLKQANDFAAYWRKQEAAADSDEQRKYRANQAEIYEKSAAKSIKQLERVSATADLTHAMPVPP